jgi:hypothetical protein
VSFRQRLGITLVVGGMAAVAALCADLYGLVFLQQPMRGAGVLLNLSSVLMALPVALALGPTRKRWPVELLVGCVYAFMAALTTLLLDIAILPLPSIEILARDSPEFLARYTAGALVVYAAASGFVHALGWYRTAHATHLETLQLEAAEGRRTRRFVERRMRPRFVAATLERIATLMTTDVDAAERLLATMARHQRRLMELSRTKSTLEQTLHALRRAWSAEHEVDLRIDGPGCEAAPDRAEDLFDALEQAIDAAPASTIAIVCRTDHDAVRVEIRAPEAFLRAFSAELVETRDEHRVVVALPKTAARSEPAEMPRQPAPLQTTILFPTLILYLVLSVLADLRHADWQPYWNATATMLIAAVLWLGAAAPLAALAQRCAIPRYGLGIAAAALLALTTGATIAGASVALLTMMTDHAVVTVTLITTILTRSVFIALAIAGVFLALGFSRVLVAAHRAAAELRDELLRAETRELEARFHPHFLFNALTSIAALIRIDPDGAAAMSRKLAGLVARTAASAGRSWWPIEDELALAADYLAIQQMRFPNRLSFGAWTIDGATGSESIPRLVLQPLLENVFKHAVSRTSAPIDVALSIRKRRRTLEMEIRNDAASDAPRAYGGGLSFIEERLRRAGGTLEVRSEALSFVVRCTVPTPGRFTFLTVA